jgi:hypothetical protein
MGYRDRGEEYGGHPAVATAICAFVLIAGIAGGSVTAAPRNGAVLLGEFLGSVSFGPILWGIAYAITIKRASPGWKIGSLIVLLLLSIVCSLAKIGAQGVLLHDDAAAARQQLQGVMANGINSEPTTPGKDAGPLARMTSLTINMTLADAKSFDTDSKAAGLQQLLSFEGITRSSPLLDHCDRLAALTEHAGQMKDRFPAYVAAGRKEGDAAVAAGTLDQASVDGFADGAAKGRASFERQWTLVGQITTDAAGLCRLLARRHWQRGADGKILFPTAELREAQPRLARIQKASAEIDQIRGAARGNMQGELDTLGKM